MSATTAPTKRTAKKAPVKKAAESKLTVEQLLAKMDKALPGWKRYVEAQGREAEGSAPEREGVRGLRARVHGAQVERSQARRREEADRQVAPPPSSASWAAPEGAALASGLFG